MRRYTRLRDGILSHIDLSEVRGVILFGSTAKSLGDGLSDVDIAIFWDQNQASYERIKIDGVEVELLRYPIGRLETLFEDEGMRNRRDTWIRACLWLNILREGQILYDRDGLISRYRERAEDWRWSEEELRLTLEGVRENIELAMEFLGEGEELWATLCLRDGLNLLTVHRMMRGNGVPSYRPREIYKALGEMEEDYRSLYLEVMGLLEEPPLEEILEISSSINSRFRRWRHSTERAFREILKTAKRGDPRLSLLSARHHALLALKEALERRDMALGLEYFHSESHLELLDAAYEVEDKLLNAYLRLQRLGGILDPGELEEKISIISGSYL